MNSILVPLDSSALAEQIMPYIRELAPLLSASVRLLQVVPEPERDSMLADSITGLYGMSEPPERYRERKQLALEEARVHAEGYLAAQASRLRPRTIVPTGLSPPATICTIGVVRKSRIVATPWRLPQKIPLSRQTTLPPPETNGAGMLFG